MMQQLRTGDRGSGGYNAALIAEVVRPTGAVTTVDIDAGVIERARTCLTATGYERVNVVLADAEHGVAEHAPYDRIIVTVGAWDIPPAWLAQLTGTGRIVVPLRFAGITRMIAFDRTADTLTADSYRLDGFVPLYRRRHKGTYTDLTVMPMGPAQKSRPSQEREAPGPLRRRVNRATRRCRQRRGIVGVGGRADRG
jgi:Protein-L-isoaspartate(D-aspartate) O-methyltransferase (PCMT)